VPFDPQPVLEGRLVTLRPLSPADHDLLFAVAADPLIWQQHPDKTRSQPAGFDAFFQQALDSGGALLAMETASGQVIGSSRFHGYDEAADEVQIGWAFLARSHWGGQYNREMKRLMIGQRAAIGMVQQPRCGLPDDERAVQRSAGGDCYRERYRGLGASVAPRGAKGPPKLGSWAQRVLASDLETHLMAPRSGARMLEAKDR
jgi:hypothetical protein